MLVSFIVVWPFVFNAARIIPDLTWEEGIGILYEIGFNSFPKIWRGKVPFLYSNLPPINSIGVVILFIGRDERDSSPMSALLKFCADKRPVNSLAPVPELPR